MVSDMSMVALMVALLLAAGLFLRFGGGHAPEPTGKAGGQGSAPLTANPPGAPNPGATLRSVQQAAAGAAQLEKQHVQEGMKGLQ
jgi:hypothetical protein